MFPHIQNYDNLSYYDRNTSENMIDDDLYTSIDDPTPIDIIR